MATSAFTTATAAALTSTLPESAKSSQQQSPRNTANNATVAVQTGPIEVSKALQEGEKFIKWDEVSSIFIAWLWNKSKARIFPLLFIFSFSPHPPLSSICSKLYHLSLSTSIMKEWCQRCWIGNILCSLKCVIANSPSHSPAFHDYDAIFSLHRLLCHPIVKNEKRWNFLSFSSSLFAQSWWWWWWCLRG